MNYGIFVFPVEWNKRNYKRDVGIRHWFGSVRFGLSNFCFTQDHMSNANQTYFMFCFGHTITPYTTAGVCVCVCTFAVKCGRYSSFGMEYFFPIFALSFCSLSLTHSLFLTFIHTQIRFLFRSEALHICISSATVALGFFEAVFLLWFYILVIILPFHSMPFVLFGYMHLLCVCMDNSVFLSFFFIRRR